MGAVLDGEGRVIAMSGAAMSAYGHLGSQIVGRPLWDLSWLEGNPAARASVRRGVRAAIRDGASVARIAWSGSDGTMHHVETRFSARRDASGRVTQVFCAGHDVTAQQEALERHQEAQRYSEALLRDLNHRAMNSLAIVGSILRQERMRHSDPGVRGALDRLKGRIAAISTLYRSLVRRPSAHATIDARGYLEGMVSEIAAATLDEPGTRIDVSTRIDQVDVPTDAAIPMGLILNELMTNCAKYAFPDGRPGRIEVTFGQTADGLVLSVIDDGIGAQSRIPEGPGLGGRLIATFAEQLDGHVVQSPVPGGGTRIDVTVGPAALEPRPDPV